MFGLRNRDTLPPDVVEELDGFSLAVRRYFLKEHNEDGTHRATVSITAGAAPIGAIIAYLGTSAPTGWLFCDGSEVLRSAYPGLFEILGTTYGVGDGATTFALPDLRQRFLLGKAASGTGSTLGSTGGTIDHTHTQTAHAHAVSGGSPQLADASGDDTISVYPTTATDITASSTGAANPPYLVVNYLIYTGVDG